MARVGVLLLNLGGPERIKDVGPFLYNLFSDPEIIRLPVRAFQKPLAWLISLLLFIDDIVAFSLIQLDQEN